MGNVLNVCEVQSLSQLHLAAERGDTETVRRILMSSANFNVWGLHLLPYCGKANVNSRNGLGETSLHLAAKNGHLATAQLLLKIKADVNAVCKKQATPLHIAAVRGHSEIVQNLIFNRANVNACNNNKMTPLHLASQYGHTSIVEILLDNYAIVDVTKQSKYTPVYLAAENGHADIADLLLSRGVCDFVLSDDRQTPLHVAVKKGHTKVVEVILKHRCTISGKLTKDEQKLQENAKNFIDTRDIKPIRVFISDGKRYAWQCVSAEVVLTKESMPLEIRTNSDGETALELAVLSTQPKMVHLLLNADQCAYSAWHLHSGFKCLIDMIRNCVENVKDGGYDEQYDENRENIKEIAQALINSRAFNVNHQDGRGGTPLHEILNSLYILRPPKRIQVMDRIKIYTNYLIQLLIEKGVDFNKRNSLGETPLMMASENGFCQVIQILLDWKHKSGLKLDIDARHRNGATALIKAAERRHVSVVRLLINNKASVNLYNYRGFTALHAAIYMYEPDMYWFDLHFFCNLKRPFDDNEYLEASSMDRPTWGGETVNKATVIGRLEPFAENEKKTWRKETVDPSMVIGRLQDYLENKRKTTRLKEVVKLLLANDETNVKAIDFRGNTPLDLAVKSSKRINSGTFEALKNRGAIHNLLEPEDEAPIEVAGIDERGRGPLHRLIISRISDDAFEIKMTDLIQDRERFHLMVDGILLRLDNFRESATAIDDKGRTPLHYAVMTSSHRRDRDLMRMLLKLGSSVNAVDKYGKTPLHYAEEKDQYEFFVQSGADENTKDNFGHTPRDLKQLRKSVTINKDNARKLPIGKKALFAPKDITQVLNTNHVTELSKRKAIRAIRICSQSPLPEESAEEAIWKIWTENKFIRLNRRLSQLKPLIHQFIKRLADGIKEKDWRFECQPILVGSADEETKVVLSADFDFNFKLNKFSQFCYPFPHPLGTKGYFQLRRKPSEDTKGQSDEKFHCFLSLDQCLLTNEVNSRFQILVEEVLRDPNFWQDEHLLEWNVIDNYKRRSEEPVGLCKTIRLRMIHPIEDGDGGFLFVNISIDVVACVDVKDWWPDDPLPVGISPAVKANGSTLVFDRPRFDPSESGVAHFIFSETFARISFAPVESRIVKESSLLMKAAYIVCKMILYSHSEATHQLKTCLLFCMEALNTRTGGETRNEEEITPKQLAYWVERIMFCFMEFSRHYDYPCYFMLSFRQRVLRLRDFDPSLLRNSDNNVDVTSTLSSFSSSSELLAFKFCVAYVFYLHLCSYDTTIDVPIVQSVQAFPCISLNPDEDPIWEQCDREAFIRTLSLRSSH